MTRSNRAVVFDRAPSALLPVMLALRVLGFRIVCVEEYFRQRFKPWKIALRAGWIERCIDLPVAPCESWAIEQAMHLSGRYRRGALQTAMSRLAISDEVWCLASRLAAQDFRRYFHLCHHVVRRIGLPADRIWIVSWTAAVMHRIVVRDGSAVGIPRTACRILGAAPLLSGCVGLVSWALGCTRVALRLVGLGVRAVRSRRSSTVVPIKVPVAIAISFPWLVKFNGPRSYDFLIDGQLLRMNDVIFLNECSLSRSFIAAETAKDRRIVAVVSNPYWAPQAVGIDRRLLKHCVAVTLRSLFSAHIHQRLAACTLVDSAMRWAGVLRHWNFATYVYANSESADQIATNMLLRKAGVATVNYVLAMGSPHLYRKENSRADERNVLWQHCNADHSVVYSDAMVDSLQSHRQFVRRYHVIGSPFAALIQATPAHALWDRLNAHAPCCKATVAAFDTSYVDDEDCMTTWDDALGFYQSLLRLADEVEGIHLLIKPSKPPSRFGMDCLRADDIHDRIRGVAAALTRRPNVRILEDTADPVEVIAAADLVVTNGFSTPSADALAAGCPAYWYDPIGSHVGYPLDMTGLVLHHYDDLKAAAMAVARGGQIPPSRALQTDAALYLLGPSGTDKGLVALRRLIAELGGIKATTSEDTTGPTRAAMEPEPLLRKRSAG